MIIFACGGTGGHIQPALTIASRLKENVYFIGGNRLEKKIITEYPFYEITTSAKNPFKIIKGFWQSVFLLARKKPRLVMATGGYVTVPIGLAAIFLRIPLFLLEQNSVIGNTNKLLAIFAKKVFLGYPLAEKKHQTTKYIITGNPVPPAKLKPNIKRNKLLIMGGSQGALSLNKSVLKALPTLEKIGLELIWITGEKNFDLFAKQLTPTSRKNEYIYQSLPIKLYSYHYNVSSLLPEIKLAISRSGAMSVAEMCSYLIPTVFVPFPFATGNHQYFNAKYIADKQVGIIDTSSDISESLNKLNLEYDTYLANLKKLDSGSALDKIVTNIIY